MNARSLFTTGCLAASLLGQGASLQPEVAARFAALALDCVHREYPNQIQHVLQSDADAKTPRQLTPAFYGCFDWHSAVHGHWLLARLCHRFPDGAFVPQARAALQQSLTEENIAGEVAYLQGKGRATFERPYGLAWLLQLDAELRRWQDPDAQRWAEALRPLSKEVRQRLYTWLPKLSHPVRTGEHSQTAFALCVILDWARVAGDGDMEQLVMQRARDYYLLDRGWSFQFEPGGQDFLSPGLAEADLMRRVLPPQEFAVWLQQCLPGLADAVPALVPAVVTDKSDGKLAHLDGLNLARGWMLLGIAAGLPDADPRQAGILAMAKAHRDAGVAAVSNEHYEGGHWLGSFAVYLCTSAWE